MTRFEEATDWTALHPASEQRLIAGSFARSISKEALCVAAVHWRENHSQWARAAEIEIREVLAIDTQRNRLVGHQINSTAVRVTFRMSRIAQVERRR